MVSAVHGRLPCAPRAFDALARTMSAATPEKGAIRSEVVSADAADPADHEVAALRPIVRAVVAAVLRATPDHPDVEDGTHESLRRALEGRSRLRKGEPLRPWLVGIARHVALDHLRSRRRAARSLGACATGGGDDADDHPRPEEQVEDPAPGPLDQLAAARRERAVRRAIDALPDGPRRALVLFHLEGAGYQEIAERLGVPLGTVATWVTRGRKMLAEKIER